MYGGDGFWMFADPSDPDYLYAEAQGGNIGRVNRKTHESRDIRPRAQYGEKLRWNWNTPIHLSPNEKGTIYIGAQYLFRSRDHGQTWDRISPDLSGNDPAKQKQEESGGITVDNSAAEMHTTIYAISESPKNGKVIWAGTDDGHVQVTRDGGKSWKDVTAAAGVPAASWVSYIDAGRFDAGTAYVTFDRHTFGEMGPMVYKATDYGAQWRALATPAQPKGLRGYAHVVREDPVRRGLLYAGTELGLWISNDDGETWAQFKGGDFPAVAVRDIAIQPRDHDLVLATHGRGIWIIDDLTPLRALTPADPRAGGGVPPDPPAAPAHRRGRRMGRGRRQLHGAVGSERGDDHLLPEVAPSVRQAEDRGARRSGKAHRHPSREQAARHQSRPMVDERRSAPRAAGRHDRGQRHARARASSPAPTRCA